MNKESTIHEWLPLPNGISVSPHDSFTEDLLKQFDRKRSMIFNDEEEIISIDQLETRPRSLSCSVHSSKSASLSSRSSQYRHSTQLDNMSIPKGETTRDINIESQGRSASNLLRKSSLYLRNKFHDHKDQHGSLFHSWSLKKKKKLNAVTNTQQDRPKLSRVAMNTTINIPQPNSIIFTSQHQPPMITQYPPKPLKYSPVEPLPNESLHAGTHKLHRISLPLIKLTALQQQQHVQRRRSDSDLLNQQTQSHSVFHSLGKKWNKLISNCRKTK